MAKFRKKPVVIEAEQFDGRTLLPGMELSLPHLGEGREVPGVRTLEGFMEASPGDWIITGVKGEHYPCKPDIFASTYEAVDD